MEISIRVLPNDNSHSYFLDNYVMQIQLPVDQRVVSIIDAQEANIVVTGKNATLSYTIMPHDTGEYRIMLESEKFQLDSFNLVVSHFELALGIDQGEINQGIHGLSNGMYEMIQGTNNLQKGMVDFSQGIGDLTRGVTLLNSNGKYIIDGMVNYQNGIIEFDSSISELVKGSEGINEGLSKVASEGKPLLKGYEQVAEGIGKYMPCPETMQYLRLAAKYSDSTNPIQAHMGMLAEIVLQQLTQIEELYNGLNMLNQGLGNYMGGVSEIAEQYDSFHSGLLMLPAATEQMNIGFQLLLDGNKDFIGGFSPINDGLAQIDKGFKDVPQNVGNLLKGQEKVKGGIDEAGQLINDFFGDKNDAEPVSFVAPERGLVNTVQFVLTTPSIEPQIKGEEAIDTSGGGKGFIGRFLDLFRK
ncbi:hypothetical protein HYG86_12275 [Alkalicella caledoniensis]|uniref:Uncharacterized protein n=1 Tax=Alkalicella caledoniensis TaxID=2731377 RepID=A0A7G9W9X5_ALKCA|nr:hypothetical protein [Alkalicella caledoniensis]QNO15487.1 hypothetical protein HYG86_12275 [Alkalicella caledoniensis]